MHQDKNLKQSTINATFDQLHLDFQVEQFNQAKTIAVECLQRAVVIATEWNLKSNVGDDPTKTRSTINSELLQVEQALNIVPNNDPEAKKINAVRDSLLKQPFVRPDGYETLISEILGVEVSNGVRTRVEAESKANFRGVPLPDLKQRSFEF